jgi:hypothetical protein
MHSRTDRLARGTVAAGIATFVAAFSHAIGGGLFPSPALLVLAFIVSVGWCTAVVGRRFSWPRVSIAVVASQALFHGTFGLAGPAGAHVVAQPGTGGAHAAHSGSTTLTLVQNAAGHGHDGAPMLLAHLGAAALTILVLRLVDSSSLGIAALARVVSSVIRAIVPVPVLVTRGSARIRPEGSGLRPSRLPLLLGGLRHRGPPAFVTAA